MNEAIRRAIEGGWKYHGKNDFQQDRQSGQYYVLVDMAGSSTVAAYVQNSEALLDPTFWSALGKAEGWEIIGEHDTRWTRDQWIKEWHRFIDHIASEGDIDTFFTNLLSQRE